MKRAIAVWSALLLTALLTSGPALPAISETAEAAATNPTAQHTRSATAGTVVKMRLRRAVTKLPVAAERRRGYDRDKFRHWIDANGDCQDTRDEVLDAESRVEVSGCDIAAGRWRSYYDGEVWTDASDVDIDHLVPLAEAWDSGARQVDRRDPDSVCQRPGRPTATGRSDRQRQPVQVRPGPRRLAARTRQVSLCTAVGCRKNPLAANRQPAGEAGAAPPRLDLRQHTREGSPRQGGPQDGTGGGGGGGSTNCAPGYSPCVPPPPPDLDCSDLDGPIKVTGSDPHNLDGDGDGWVCEPRAHGRGNFAAGRLSPPA